MQTYAICTAGVAATLAAVTLVEHDRPCNGEGCEKGGEDDGEAHVFGLGRFFWCRRDCFD